MMVLWRISNYADLKGLGGLRAPARWHFAGQPVVYLAEHPAGALLETLVHQEIGSTADLPDTYQLLRVQVDDGVTISEMAEATCPPDWRDDQAWTQAAGTEWLTHATSALLKVPSAVMPFAFNYILNPAHEDAARIEISMAIDVRQDPRILRLLRRP
ncbi:RES family NAD+ phosphorylase [Paraburkholderia sp. BL23I1N1]|uniref:RES family NAD+ phosphorylase n=1 Tax=Paraburkholderia sp. BL23I1N1 TaxID=1938802 RepID=UPI000E720FD9|nr:RES family NAD+ phosphorylase [Paraburkholderia sp. BL23I1N1]